MAGNGIQGFRGDNGPATTAYLNNPFGVTIDNSGNIYIADNWNHRIRKVASGTGIITTVAGNGIYGFSGDNGSATAANLYNPKCVTLDNIGNLYITDWGTGRIRKVYLSQVQIPTVTALVSSATGNSSVSGSAVTFTATVTSSEGIPTSTTVTFKDGGASIGSGVLDTTGTAKFTTSSLAPGSHNISASYPNTGMLVGSTSPVLVQVVIGSPIVTTGIASSISATTATLDGTVNDNGAVTTVNFEYGLTTIYGSSISGGSVAAGNGATPVSASINGLACNTTYHFRVTASNGAGSTNGTDATLTTAPCSILTISLLGSGGGAVNSDPAGIACASGSSSGCTNSFINGVPIALVALSDWKSTFTGWGDPCNGTESCIITLNGNAGVSALFAMIPRVRIPGSNLADFATLQDAYDQVVSSDSIRAKVYAFSERPVSEPPVIFDLGRR